MKQHSYRSALRKSLFVSILCVSVLFNSFGVRASSVSERFDQVGGASHPYETYGQRPSGGWNQGGGTAGSYYHYHVPLVQQNQGWGWGSGGGGGWGAESSKGHDILLWGLALLAGLAILGSLLLPLLLIPLGLSLLALLMGGMMMMMMPAGMMMMMMMMPPQPQASRSELVGRALDTVTKIVKGDTEGAFENIMSTLEMDTYCPENFVCNLGLQVSSSLPQPDSLESFSTILPFMEKLNIKPGDFFSGNANKPPQIFSKFIPKFQKKETQRFVRRMEKALWTGLTIKNCEKMEMRCRKIEKLREMKNAQNTNETLDANNLQNVTIVEHQQEPQTENDGKRQKGYGFQIFKPTFSTPTILM